jgi:GTPase SAR1 family protein
MPIVAWAGLLIGVPGLIALVVVSIVEEEWAAFASVLFGLVTSMAVLWHLLRRHRAKEVPETTVFRPFASLEPNQTWPRSDVEDLVDEILNPNDRIPFVVGASGVGKSTLLNVMVRERIARVEEGVAYTVLSARYSTLVEQLEMAMSDCNPDRQTVIVVDQFEQWLALMRPKGWKERRKAQRKLRKLLRKAQKRKKFTVVISVRREWYFDTGFLGKLVPAPHQVNQIEEPALEDAKDPMRAGIRRSFVDVLDDEKLADKILKRLSPTGRLSPLQAQVVGAVLERKIESGVEIDIKYFDDELGGVAGAIDAYFKEVLEGSARPELCLKILYALSVKTRYRTRAKLSMLVDSLYENTDTVKAELEYLVDQRLVTKPSSGTYALAHDFLAEFFNAKSGSELEPTVRDNIQIYAAAEGEHSPVVSSRNRSEVHQRKPFGMIVVACLLVFMTVRFFDFGIDWVLLGPDVSRTLVGDLFDASFLLIFVPYAAWIFYCGLFYDRLLVHLRESRFQRIFSIFIVLNLIISVLIGAFIPVAWLVGVASGGIFFAVKMLWLSRHPDLNRSAQKRLRHYGIPTLINLLIVGGIGIVGIVFSVREVDPGIGSDVSWWIGANLVASLMVTYSCLVLAPRHVSRESVAQMLGLIGRPGSKASAYLED